MAQAKSMDAGTVTSVTARLTLTAAEPGSGVPALRFLRQPVGVITERMRPFALSVLAFGGGTTEYKYSWTKNEQPVIGDGTDPSKFEITSAELSDQGTYKVTVQAGSATITSDPVQVTVGQGVPVAGGLGLAAFAAVSALAGVMAMRRRK